MADAWEPLFRSIPEWQAALMERALTVCVGATLLPERLIIEPDPLIKLRLTAAPRARG